MTEDRALSGYKEWSKKVDAALKVLEDQQAAPCRLEKELEGQYFDLARERAAHDATQKAFKILVDGVTKK